MLHSLKISNFRNISSDHWEFEKGANLLLGDNGAGKTSFLEAIYLLATTRSFRTSRLNECCNFESSSFRLEGIVDYGVRNKLFLEWLQARKTGLVNDKRLKLVDYLGILPVVAWSSRDIQVLIGPPEFRRRFLDRGVIGLNPRGLICISRYRRVLREKRSLLQRRDRELEAWNALLAREASDLVDMRASYVNQLEAALDEILKESQLLDERPELLYQSTLQRGLQGPDAVFEELMSYRQQEIEAGTPLVGPHRDELTIRWHGHTLKSSASAGEMKGIMLALLLAHGRLLSHQGSEAVYLFDDVDVELDETRLGRLWTTISGLNQAFLSSNRPQIWSKLSIPSVWHCNAGRIIRSPC